MNLKTNKCYKTLTMNPEGPPLKKSRHGMYFRFYRKWHINLFIPDSMNQKPDIKNEIFSPLASQGK